MDTETKFENTKHSYFYSGAEGLIDYIAGAAGGIATVATGQPLDTVKVKMQAFPNLYRNSLQCFLATLKQDKMRGIYAGALPGLMANTAENATTFSLYGICKKGIANLENKSPEALKPSESGVAGSAAALIGTLIVCPAEVVKCRLQALRETSHGNLKEYISPFKMTRNIWRSEGVTGLYSGLSATIIREGIGHYFFFYGYELAWKHLKTEDDHEKNMIKTSISGAVGGLAFWLSIFPIDVVKSKIQIQGSGAVWPILQETLKSEGFGGLFNGIGPTLLKTLVTSAALCVTFEETCKVLKKILNRCFD